MMPETTPTNAGEQPELMAPEEMSYEQAKGELRVVVQALESGSIPLEDTLDLWQRGEQLAARCKQILDQAAQRVNQSEMGPAEDKIIEGSVSEGE